jgi:hypothetical protein
VKTAPAPAAAATAIPHLQKQGTATQMIVDGKPFLALAGELSNSAPTTVEYMKLVWPRLAQHKGLNTVLAGVSWNLVEPQEGKFDFSVLDAMIQGARAHNYRLVLLWFGTWKNGLSSYVPDWVKKDQDRFPRVTIVGDQTPWPVWGVSKSQFTGPMNIELLSPYGEATRDADTHAYVAMLRHIKAVDGQQHTIIAIQVENEMGIQGDTRDRSAGANKAFNGPVPKELLDYIQPRKDTLIPEFRKVWESTGFKTSGTWEEVFGKGRATEEIFMAWSYARYIDRIAAAGKAEYPIPMITNCPQNSFGRAPAPLKGSGQSGGPMPDAFDVYRAGAPHIDLFGADIYSPDFVGFTKRYTQSGNPLFIPEIRGDMEGRVLYAFGRHDAICISLMGIERLPAPETEMIKGFQVIKQLEPLIVKHQGKGSMSAVILGQKDPAQKVTVGNYTFEVSFATPRGLPGTPALTPPFPSGVALFIAVGPDEYYIAGNSASVRVAPSTGTEHAGLATVEEGTFVNSRWIVSRQIAGDETGQGQDISLRSTPPDRIPDGYVGIQHIKLYRYR